MEATTCSIIIPSYNHGEHIERSVNSALTQTFNDIEVLVIDDGSTDDTYDRLKKFDGRIRYIRQENGGLGNARNTGIEASRGEYLQFLDADDEIDASKVEVQIREFENDGLLDLVYSDCAITGLEGDHPRNASTPMPEDDALTTLVRKNPFPVHAAIVRKSAVIQVGMFDESRAIHEDWDLWLRLALCGSRFRYLPGNLAHYHQEFSTISMDPELMFDRGKNLLEKHLDNPDFANYGRHRDRFAASQYIFLANVARNQGCWNEGRTLLSKAAGVDWRALDLRLWLYFPESFVRRLIDRISGNVRVVPRNIRLAIEAREAKV